MTTKEIQQNIVDNMQQWQQIENASVASTQKVIESTDNHLVKLVMEIIKRDSEYHHFVQDFIVRSLQSSTIALSIDDLEKIWDKIEKHIELEKKTIKFAKDSLEAIQGKKMLV